MTNSYGPISVWGARDATLEDINGLEEHWVDLTDEDITRRQRKLTRAELKQGSYGMDGLKYAPKPQFAAVYRADGSRHPVPLATFRRYLRKRDKNGDRIFFPYPPEEAPELASDPCPVRIGARICGKRMLDQYELILHIWRKHESRAPYYLNKHQLDFAQKKLRFVEGVGIPDEPSTAPVPTPRDAGLVDLGVALEEAVEDKRAADKQKAQRRAADRAPATMTPVEVIKRPIRAPRTNTPHTCEKKGRLGVYDPSCPRCIELTADKMVAVNTVTEGVEDNG